MSFKENNINVYAKRDRILIKEQLILEFKKKSFICELTIYKV